MNIHSRAQAIRTTHANNSLINTYTRAIEAHVKHNHFLAVSDYVTDRLNWIATLKRENDILKKEFNL